MEWIQIAQIVMCTIMVVLMIGGLCVDGIEGVFKETVKILVFWAIMEVLLGRWPKF